MQTDNKAQGAWSCLSGVRILDLSQLMPGPQATLWLQQLGAEVIKIERPHTGDSARMLGPAVFARFNRGKRTVALDLKQAEGRQRFLDMVATADAVVEGFRPGVMARLGLDYPALAAVNPRLVMCSISGFGQTGPYADRPAHDLNYLALAGYWAAPAQLDDAVARPRVRLADFAAASHAALALAVAICSARLSGVGQHLDVSIHDAILSWTAHGAWAARAPRDADAPPAAMPDNDLFLTADGRHVALGILENHFWLALRDALGDDYPALHDARFEHRAGRQRAARDVQAVLAAMFRSRTLSQWIAVFDGLDIPFAPCLSAEELFADAHVKAREVVIEVGDEGGIATRFPVRFSLGLPPPSPLVPALPAASDDASHGAATGVVNIDRPAGSPPPAATP